MDAEAKRRALREDYKKDLTEVYSDDEASPPEWVDLLDRIIRGTGEVKQEVITEAEAFADEPDIRIALARRERLDAKLRAKVAEVNTNIRRLNLIAPSSRFSRGILDADEILRPLYRTERRSEAR